MMIMVLMVLMVLMMLMIHSLPPKPLLAPSPPNPWPHPHSPTADVPPSCPELEAGVAPGGTRGRVTIPSSILCST